MTETLKEADRLAHQRMLKHYWYLKEYCHHHPDDEEMFNELIYWHKFLSSPKPGESLDDLGGDNNE